MIAYRIARREYIEDLSGYGAFLFGGRWNEQGVPALYLSSSLTLAMLEILVHASNENPPVNMYFAEVYVPDEIYEEPVVKLPQNQSSVDLGSEWLKSKKSPFYKSPVCNPSIRNSYGFRKLPHFLFLKNLLTPFIIYSI